MRYEQPEPITPDEDEPLLRDPDPDVVCQALVRVVHSDVDLRWAQARCIDAASSPHLAVRQAAATCLGHLARLHGKLDTAKVMPVLRRLLADPATQGVAEDALEDLQTFKKRS